MLAGTQEVPEVERIRAAGHAHLLERVLLDRNLPGAAPREGAEPNVATLLVVVSFMIDRKPGIILGAGRAAAAFQHRLTRVHWLLLQCEFARPTATQVAQTIICSARQVPGSCRDLLERNRRLSVVLDISPAPKNARFRVDRIMQYDDYVARNILHYDRKLVAADRMRDVFQHEITIAIWKGDLQVRLNENAATPARKLLRRRGRRKIERRKSGGRLGGREMVSVREPLPPVEGLQLPTLVDAEHIARPRRIESKHVCRLIKRHLRDGLCRNSRGRQHDGGKQYAGGHGTRQSRKKGIPLRHTRRKREEKGQDTS